MRLSYPFTFSANLAPVQDIAPEAAVRLDSAASLRTAVLFIETHTFIQKTGDFRKSGGLLFFRPVPDLSSGDGSFVR